MLLEDKQRLIVGELTYVEIRTYSSKLHEEKLLFYKKNILILRYNSLNSINFELVQEMWKEVRNSLDSGRLSGPARVGSRITKYKASTLAENPALPEQKCRKNPRLKE